MSETTRKLVIETKDDNIEIPDDQVEAVWYGNQKVSDLQTLITAIEVLGEKNEATQRSHHVKQSEEMSRLHLADSRRTRQIVRAFGFCAISVAMVAIGLGSYLVHAENIDMVKIDAIYNRINAVEASPFQTGELVRFKAIGNDRSGSNMQNVAIGALDMPLMTGVKSKMIQADYTECRGEILEHWQTEQGIWYASVSLDGAFKYLGSSTDGASGFVKARDAVIFVVPEGRLSLANDQKNTVHKDRSRK